VKTATTNPGGLPIVAGKPYDEEDEFADAILRGIRKGIAQCKAREAAEAADRALPKRRELPKGFREVGRPGDAWIIPGGSKSS
jgi:hypothetical protein